MSFLLKRLKHDIEKHYDEFMPHAPMLKVRHIMYLERFYDRSRFANCEDLDSERARFLSELQEMVNSSLFREG